MKIYLIHAELNIHETKVIQPRKEIPPGSKFKGYQDYTVQELLISPHNTLYRLASAGNANGRIPSEENYRQRCVLRVTLECSSKVTYSINTITAMLPFPLLLEQMHEWTIDISAGQLNRIMGSDKDKYHGEKQDILRVGLSVSSYINTDDTSARHQGVNRFAHNTTVL